jgi:hypothetical protein
MSWGLFILAETFFLIIFGLFLVAFFPIIKKKESFYIPKRGLLREGHSNKKKYRNRLIFELASGLLFFLFLIIAILVVKLGGN